MNALSIASICIALCAISVAYRNFRLSRFPAVKCYWSYVIDISKGEECTVEIEVESRGLPIWDLKLYLEVEQLIPLTFKQKLRRWLLLPIARIHSRLVRRSPYLRKHRSEDGWALVTYNIKPSVQEGTYLGVRPMDEIDPQKPFQPGQVATFRMLEVDVQTIRDRYPKKTDDLVLALCVYGSGQRRIKKYTRCLQPFEHLIWGN